MELTINTSTCDIKLKVELGSTVKSIKESLYSETGIHPRYQCLTYFGETLLDEYGVLHYKMENKASIEFKIIVPKFDDVLEAVGSLKTHVDSSANDTLVDAMITLKAFVDCHSCCASVIIDMLKSKELADEKNAKIKSFCEKLLVTNSVLEAKEKSYKEKTETLFAKVESFSEMEKKIAELEDKISAICVKKE
ncbi:uncharacterized protein LOC119081355 [Bradysia coprophila]|uniref:uncharacterized protein LOC119081355 n=1 Tax=Bradysia coprophila TaxID=38358 RepID=UPI00187DD129|nr:uncharacterized protein LOC119081355 [Bradysia coprophila]